MDLILRVTLLFLYSCIAESQLDAKLDVTGNYIGQGICNKEVEVPLWVNCRLSYLNITNYVKVPPLVRWSYKGLKSSEFNKSSVDTAFTICHLEDMNTYLCKYRRKHTCTPDFDGWYKCDIAVETTDGKEAVFSDDVIIFDQGQYDGDALGECFMPEVNNFRAQLVNNSEIFLDWDTTPLPDGEVYCDRSRRFLVNIFTYDTFNDYQNKRPIHQSFYVATAERRDTNFTLPFNSTYTVKKFYVFHVRNQYIRGDINGAPNLLDSRRYKSDVFYFGEAALLDLVTPALPVEKKRVSVDSLESIGCEAVGFPPPVVTMWFEGNLVAPVRRTSQLTQVSLTKFFVPASAGRYMCNAVGYYLRPTGGFILHSRVKFIDVEVYQKDITSDILCTTPSYSNCSRFLLGRSVLVNSTLIRKVDDVVDVLSKLADRSTDLASRCLEAAQAVVCHSSYPFCFNNTSSQKICKETCDLFRRGGACAAVINASGVNSDIQDLILSNCDHREDSAGDFPECFLVPFEVINDKSKAPSWCSMGRGVGYAGHVSITWSGRLCQDWNSQSPHPHAVYSGTAIHGALNQCRNPEGRGTRPWCYTIDRNVRWEYCDNVPRCEACVPYTETFCSSLQGYGHGGLVHLNRHESQWSRRALDGAELWMNREWHRLSVSAFNLSSACLLNLRELICHKTVPLCRQAQDSPYVLKMCSDHCKASKLFHSCPGGLVRKIETDMELDTITFSTLECGLDTEENSDRCMTSQAFALATDHIATVIEHCYNMKDGGQSYNGTVSRSHSGQTCRPWGSLLPGAKNYCRNPGKVTTRPWCYINDTAWEHCDIPECKKPSVTEPLIATAIVGLSSFAISMVIFFIVLGISIILCAVFIAMGVLYMRRRKMRKRPIRKYDVPSKQWDYVRNTMYAKVESPSKDAKLKKVIDSFPQFDKSSIHYVRQIGQGNFGVVFYAKAECIVPDEKLTEVAVKTLKEESCTEALEDFVREAKLMFGFDHENIVKIFGVSTESIPYYLIFEYMNKGDLAHFLRDSASSAQRRHMALNDGRPRSRTESSQSNEPPALSSDQLRDICKQIASGMKYLAGNNHIHRDLACRNCLVKLEDPEQTESSLTIKIGDFGMSHNLYSADYYRVKGSAILPVRWMSPEAIIYGKFSTESDVWSFGVVMWEVFSFAMQPYYGTSNEEVTEAIRRHKILKQPVDCSNSMYEIMKQCWNLRANLRPTFGELYTQLDEFRASLSSDDSHSIDYFNSNSSDLDSDAFLEENSVDDVDGAL